MNLSNSELDQLFENVRKEKPVASYEETERAFLAAVIASAGGVLATKGLLKLFTFKQWIMMISVMSAATVGTLLVTMSASPEKKSENALLQRETKVESIINADDTDELLAENELKNSASLALGPEMPEMEIVTQLGKPPILVRAYLKDDGTYHFEYFITQETTEEDLKKLQAEAKVAGFELKYEPTFTDNKLARLNLQIVQIKENGQRQNIQISDINLKESPNYKVAWNVNEEGFATSIACGEELKLREADQKALDDLMQSIELEELIANMENIKMIEISRNMEGVEEILREELNNLVILRDMEIADVNQLIAAEELLAQINLDDIIKELDAIDTVDEEVMEEARRGLEEAHEQLEAAHEELERHREHMKHECDAAKAKCEQQKSNCREGSKVIRAELVKDGLIDSDEKKVKMDGGKGKLKVNGQDVPKDLRNKYKDLIKEYFEIDVDNKDLKWNWEHTNDND